MERSLLLAKKYQHLTVSEDQYLRAELEGTTPSLSGSAKSGAIENLLSQNEDLSARLKVLLRRLASIEEENLKLTQEHREMKHQWSGLNDQLAVFKEKDSNWKERALVAEQALEIQQSQLRQKEVEFAKLRAQEWEMRENLKSQLEHRERAYHRLFRYRARIQQWIKPCFKNFKFQLGEKEVKIEQLKREIQNTEIQCQNLIQKNLEQVKKSRDAFKNSEEEKIQLIAQFEQHHKDLKNEIHSLTETSHELRKKAAMLERSLERQDYLENRLIFAERENQELRSKFNEEFSSVQNQMYEWRTKAQSLEVERDSIQQKYLELDHHYKRTKEVAERLDEQMESLRLLWKEKVHENERLKKNHETIEALNSELSIKLNELRTQVMVEKNT